MAAAALAVLTAACPIFRVVYQPGEPLINASLAADNKHGIEDGIVVRAASGELFMIGAEMWEDPKWVSMLHRLMRTTGRGAARSARAQA